MGNYTNISLTYAACYAVGNGAHVCNVTFNSTGTSDTEFQGLNYTPTTAFYFSGSNPTFDAILDEGTSTTFQLWFQVTSSSGAIQAVVYLHLGELSRS